MDITYSGIQDILNSGDNDYITKRLHEEGVLSAGEDWRRWNIYTKNENAIAILVTDRRIIFWEQIDNMNTTLFMSGYEVPFSSIKRIAYRYHPSTVRITTDHGTLALVPPKGEDFNKEEWVELIRSRCYGVTVEKLESRW